MSTAESVLVRRDFLRGTALLALAMGVPAGAVRLSPIDDAELGSERQRRLIKRVADLVIPATRTPGAGKVGVGDFVILALAHGLSETRAPLAAGSVTAALRPLLRPDGSLRYLDWLERTLDDAANSDFLARSDAEQIDVLTILDSQAMSPGAPWSPWVAIKGLILTGYYTSEVGGSQELRYELVPGRFDPNSPLGRDDSAWSSDWTAVEFG